MNQLTGISLEQAVKTDEEGDETSQRIFLSDRVNREAGHALRSSRSLHALAYID